MAEGCGDIYVQSALTKGTWVASPHTCLMHYTFNRQPLDRARVQLQLAGIHDMSLHSPHL